MGTLYLCSSNSFFDIITGFDAFAFLSASTLLNYSSCFYFLFLLYLAFLLASFFSFFFLSSMYFLIFSCSSSFIGFLLVALVILSLDIFFWLAFALIPEFEKACKFFVLGSLLLTTFLLLLERDLDFSTELCGEWPLFLVYL